MFDPTKAPDPDLVYSKYLRTCAMLGIEPTPRERALGLIQEWTERLSGRPDGALAYRAALDGGFNRSTQQLDESVELVFRTPVSFGAVR